MTKVIDRFRRPLPRRFPEWVQNRYAAAVHELKKLDNGSARYWAFVWECLASAETARAWKAANKRFEFDSDSLMRKSDERYFETIEDLISSVDMLATQLERYPLQAAWTVGQALLELKSEVGYIPLKSLTSIKDGLNPFGYGPGTAPDIVGRLLRHMSAVLAVAKTQKSVQWKQFGPILFEEFPTVGGRPPDMLVRGLLFEAVFFSRTFTSGGLIPPAFGRPMPAVGDPRWALAVALLSGALDVFLDEKTAEKRLSPILKRKFRPTWCGWRDPPAEFVDLPTPGNGFDFFDQLRGCQTFESLLRISALFRNNKQEIEMITPLYNQYELAKRWKMSGRTLERWRWLKQGPSYIKLGGRIVYRLEDIEAYEKLQTCIIGNNNSPGHSTSC